MLTVQKAYQAGRKAAFAKFAAIFGAEVPDAIEHAAIPYEHRRQLYEDYARQKSQEEPTGYGKAMGIGGLVGGLGGAALGALLGGQKGSTLTRYGGGPEGAVTALFPGAAIGGLLGAGAGGLMAHSDKGNIEHAQHVMSHEDNLDPALAKQIQDMIESRRSAEQFSQTRRDWRDRSRHDELMNALRNRGGI